MKKKSLLKMIKLPMSDRQRKAMERIDAEDNGMIIYLTAKHHQERGQSFPKEYYEAGCLALKQYYATSIFDRKNMHAISSALDPFWHAHILDTVPYKLLCDDIQGFMHHDPLNKADKQKVKVVKDIFSYTREVLIKIFGENNLDDRFYPSEPLDAVVVCLHDLPEHLALDDVFEINPKIQKYRKVYGHEAREKIIKSALKEIFK